MAQAPGRRELLAAAGDPALGRIRLSVSAQDRVCGVHVAYRRKSFLQWLQRLSLYLFHATMVAPRPWFVQYEVRPTAPCAGRDRVKQ